MVIEVILPYCEKYSYLVRVSSLARCEERLITYTMFFCIILTDPSLVDLMKAGIGKFSVDAD